MAVALLVALAAEEVSGLPPVALAVRGRAGAAAVAVLQATLALVVLAARVVSPVVVAAAAAHRLTGTILALVVRAVRASAASTHGEVTT